MEPKVTDMLLILPETYKKFWKEKHGDLKKNLRLLTTPAFSSLFKKLGYEIPLLKFAEIRKSSGRVGEVRYRNIEEISSITAIEPYTTQKRWYKTMITYSEAGTKAGKPLVEFLYFYIDPWILVRLIEEREQDFLLQNPGSQPET